MKSKNRHRAEEDAAKFQERIRAVRLTNRNSTNHIERGSANVPNGWMLLVCDSGEMSLTVNSQRETVVRNSVLIIPPKQLVSIGDYSDDIVLYFVYLPVDDAATSTERTTDTMSENSLTLMSQQRAMMLATGSHHSIRMHILPETAIQNLTKLIDVLIENIDNGSPNHLRLRSLLINCISIIITESAPCTEEEVDKKNSRQKIVVDQFFDELIQEYRNQHDVAYYAKRLGITPKYLSTLVRNETGEAALQWINRIVVFGAKKMIGSTRLSIAEISEELHFSSPSAFIRFFKKQTGNTPHAFRS